MSTIERNILYEIAEYLNISSLKDMLDIGILEKDDIELLVMR